jgi:hypothetical protein
MSIFEEVPAEEAEEIAAEEVEAEAETEESEEVSDVEETAKALDAFLADFSVENGELVATKAEESEETAVEEIAEEVPAVEESEVSEEAAAEKAVEDAPVKYRTKTNIFLLILYIFLALPATVAGVALLLIPTVLFLALAANFTLG